MAEMEESVARERQRRETWLSGPTEAEKADWARQERERRLSQMERTRPTLRLTADAARFVQRSMRQAHSAPKVP